MICNWLWKRVGPMSCHLLGSYTNLISFRSSNIVAHIRKRKLIVFFEALCITYFLNNQLRPQVHLIIKLAHIDWMKHDLGKKIVLLLQSNFHWCTTTFSGRNEVWQNGRFQHRNQCHFWLYNRLAEIPICLLENQMYAKWQIGMKSEANAASKLQQQATSSASLTLKEREDFILNSLLNFVKSLGKRVPDETNTGGARLELKTFWPGSIGVGLDWLVEAAAKERTGIKQNVRDA